MTAFTIVDSAGLPLYWVEQSHMPAPMDSQSIVGGHPPSQDCRWTGAYWEPRIFDYVSARAAQWEKIKRDRDAREFGLFSWDGSVFNGDAASQNRIGRAALKAFFCATTSQPFSEPWTLADNTVRVLSASDMIQVAQAMGAATSAAYATSRSLRTAIESATTKEGIEAISWPAGE